MTARFPPPLGTRAPLCLRCPSGRLAIEGRLVGDALAVLFEGLIARTGAMLLNGQERASTQVRP
jgi:hypothetical protein